VMQIDQRRSDDFSRDQHACGSGFFDICFS
jgi:hypothetical protein